VPYGILGDKSISLAMMDVFYSLLLCAAAFWLGACPFSVWLGKRFLGKDITRYGDGNPGAANVFRAGSSKLGLVAVLLDIAKGVPFVLMAHLLFELPTVVVMAVGLSAILGHAYSPILQMRGGKSVAITFGVLIALPQHDILVVYAIFTLLAFLFIEQHSWTAMSGPIGSFGYLVFIRGVSWELLFMLCVLGLFIIRQHQDLRAFPSFRMNIIHWLQSKKRET
jgi:glycerol-3-phosphate acyltransferase PlsY